ncbi:InlB B-repeat-containing protein [Adlercreutzia murintestinalis]|uniref:InlB B-repeat-containing protein n=1 Tax=Adlercreutzia murintestinalis TaxID=2941325 RepID=UPI0020403BFC|nr:hypothetical protein [Adlercreutzia murintestinalis]
MSHSNDTVPTTSEAEGKTTYTYRIPTAAFIGCTELSVSFKEATKEPERFEVSVLVATDGTGTGTVRLESGGAEIASGHVLSVVEPSGASLLVEPAAGSKATVTPGTATTGVEVVPDTANKWVSFTFEQLKALGDQKSISVYFETTESVQPTYTHGQYVFGRVTADHTLHAYFAPVEQLDTNTHPTTQAGAFNGDSSGGTVTLPATLPAGVTQGSLQITFVAYDDYEVVHASVSGDAGAQGGRISPAGSMSKIVGSNTQQFVIEPASGYDVDSVVVQEAGKDAWTVSRADVLAGAFSVTNISADTQVRANFVSVFYTVDISLTEGGTVQADGKAVANADQVRVLRGRTLPVVVTPHDNYQVTDISTSGLVFMQAQEGGQERVVGNTQPQADVARAQEVEFVSMAADPVERANSGDGAFGLRVAGPGTLRVAFDGKQIAPDPNVPYCTVTTKSNGHGTISASAGQVAKGSQVQIGLTPESGYHASSIVIECDGTSTTVSPVQSGYSFTVEGDTVVTANFALTVTPGPSNPALRALQQLRSLASTGDLNMPGALLLMCVACAAVGVALLSNGRLRRREREAREE